MAKEKARVEKVKTKVEKGNGERDTITTTTIGPQGKQLERVSTSSTMIGTARGETKAGESMNTTTAMAKITGATVAGTSAT